MTMGKPKMLGMYKPVRKINDRKKNPFKKGKKT